MNIDDLKGSYQSLSFGDEGNSTEEFKRKVENIIDKIKDEDRRVKIRVLAGLIVVIGFVLAYCIMGLIKYIENPEGTGFWGYSLYVLALITMLPFIFRKFLRFRHVDYDVPVNRFIENAEKRYALFHIDQLALIPFIIILDFSLIYMNAGGNLPSIKTILMSQIVMVFAITIGLLIGLIFWNRKLVILNEIRRIKESLE